MFLQKLVIENVKSIEKLEMPFVTPDGHTRKWTMLLGENGTGKTTILQSIALLLAGSEALPELLVDPSSWIRLGKDEATLHADLVTADGEKRTIDFTIRRGDTTRSVFSRNATTLDALDNALAHSPRNYLTIGYGVSRRLRSEVSNADPTSSVYRQQRAQSVATLFSPDAVLNPLESWAIDLDYRRGEEGLDIVKKALAGLLPGVEFERIDKQQRRLMFNTPEGNLPFSALSAGYQNVAAWSSDLLYRITEIFADYKDPLSARGLLLVDEIDLHLHPVWERQLTTVLSDKLPNFQIVATTHSPLTAQQVGEGELFTLRRESLNSAPSLQQYSGAPRNLTLQQLVASPIFGLSTVYSTPVEEMRDEYNHLKSLPKSKLTAAERKKLSDLQGQLEDLPVWPSADPLAQKQQQLLEEIGQALKNGGNSSQKA